MSIEVIDKRSGRYGLDINVTKREIKALSKVENLSLIQFVEPVKDINVWKNIERHLLSKRPKVGIRVYGHYSEECNLGFLQYIPSTTRFFADCLSDCKNIESLSLLKNLEELSIGIFHISNFDFLNNISNKLSFLFIGETKSISINISHIKRFKNLEVFYNDGMKKGLDNLQHLKNLKKLTLRGVKLANLDFLSELKNIERLSLLFGSYKSLDSISNLKSLKEIEFSRVRQIPDYEFLNSLENLEQIEFEGMSKMTSIPDLSRLRKLKKIVVDNNSRLQNISSIGNIQNLKAFRLIFSQSSKVKEIDELLNQAYDLMLKSNSIRFTNILDSFDSDAQQKLIQKGIKLLKWDTVI